MNLVELSEKVLAVTAEHRDVKGRVLTHQEGEIMAVLNDKGVPPHVVKTFKALTEAILGSKLSGLSDRVSMPQFTAVVPLTNPNGHNYEIGSVAVAVVVSKYTRSAISILNPMKGNNLPRIGDGCRYATDEEIKAFFLEYNDIITEKSLKEALREALKDGFPAVDELLKRVFSL